MPNKKTPVSAWQERSIEDWTVRTFQEYLKCKHKQLYGIDYVTRNYGIEGRWLKSMIAEHGAEVVHAFIDACFIEYRPTAQYPGLNFSFMFTYQRSRILPRVLAEVKRAKDAEVRRQQTKVDVDDLAEWL